MTRYRAGMAVWTTALLSTLGAAPAWADQCAWNAKDVSDKGRDLIAKAQTILALCEPCGERKPKPMQVNSVSVVPKGEGYFAVVVNKEEVDLAYVFAPGSGDSWFNIGLAVNCGASDVSKTIRAPKPAGGPRPR